MESDNRREIAHVKRNPDGSWAEPHWLEEHLEGTAHLAADFARVFGSAAWAYALGIGHDTGKSTPDWQKYIQLKSGYTEDAHLETKAGRIDHSTPSAILFEQEYGKSIGRILSYCAAGHHAGLPDWMGSQSSLAFRLQNAKTAAIPQEYRIRLAQYRPGVLPWQFGRDSIDLSLWIRMLFSCLVDADFLDTEAYMSPEKKVIRGGYLSVPELLNRLDAFLDVKSREAIKNNDGVVNRARQRVLADCRNAASLAPGFFSLTVPTGGGKTLSSLAFAIEHAKKFGKERVVYVIPYTSIIEQNADVFRSAVGAEQVVEHHSNLDDDDSTLRARIAAENWDAPLVVTTSVQFFESLFAAKPSRCRKLHNIANSVVVIDEAQLLPIEFLEPLLAALSNLCERYGVSVVICTATQPVFERRRSFPDFAGLAEGSVREIIQNVPRLYDELRRVEVEIPLDLKTPQTWETIAQELAENKQALCVVSDRKSCRELFSLMPKGTYHLSALMCAQHRSAVIDEIKKGLKLNAIVRVISTQLVEAGVDIDFPVVYRALAGLDSIAQAAGRCNREGKMNEIGKMGKVVVFVPPRKAPAGILRKAADTAASMLVNRQKVPIDHAAFETYFSELYWKANSLDGKDILRLLRPEASECGIQFREAANAFKIIDDKMQKTVLVPYGEGANLIRILKRDGPERWLLRKLQRYAVTIYTNQFTTLLNQGSLEEAAPGVFSLTCEVEYDTTIGLLVDDAIIDPAVFIA